MFQVHFLVSEEGRSDGIMGVFKVLGFLVPGQKAPAQKTSTVLGGTVIIVVLQLLDKLPELLGVDVDISDSLIRLSDGRRLVLLRIHFKTKTKISCNPTLICYTRLKKLKNWV